MQNGNGNGNGRIGTDGDTFADVLEDWALRRELDGNGSTALNADPALIMVARESAAAILADYLEHVRLQRAARQVIARIGGTVVTN